MYHVPAEVSYPRGGGQASVTRARTRATCGVLWGVRRLSMRGMLYGTHACPAPLYENVNPFPKLSVSTYLLTYQLGSEAERSTAVAKAVTLSGRSHAAA